jgi:hypothetical protein
VIALGLASRKFAWLLPDCFDKYPGDALWTAAVYLGGALIWPGASAIRLFIFSLATSFTVEVLQLYHAPWIDAIRSNPLGHLFLGTTFNPPDFVAYTAGALLCLAADSSQKGCSLNGSSSASDQRTDRP